ncbi:MAG: hypothetical protein Q4E39_02770 [bacterium]|nr:hypothetical protein [bacterium]
MAGKYQTIYEYLNDYTKEQIDEMLEKLSDEEKALVLARYGEDLNNPVFGKLSKQQRDRFYGALVPKMKKLLSNSNNNIKEKSEKIEPKEDTISNQEKQEEKLPTKENSPVKTNVETITKSDYIEMLELLKTPIFNKMKDVLTIKETVIISLKFGYIDEKYFSNKAIAEFLGIEQNEVIEILKKALLLYKENYKETNSNEKTIHDDFNNLKELAENFPDNDKIQKKLIVISKQITEYIKEKNYEEAERIAKKFPNNEVIQGQLITIYMKQEEYDEAIEIAKKFPNNEVIQGQLLNIRFCINDSKEFPTEIKNIRSKLSLGKVSYMDIETLDNNKDKISANDYILIKLAIYDKMGYKKQATSILKDDTMLDADIKKKLTSYLEKKRAIFDLKKWDILIGWSSDLDEYQKNEKEQELNKSSEQENYKEANSNEKTVHDDSNITHTTSKSSPLQANKTKTNQIPVSLKNVSKISNSPYSIKKLSQKKQISTTNNSSKDTIYDHLSYDYKEKVFELKVQYYADMGVSDTRESAIYKYDRLEDILVSKPNQNNLELLLLMLVGDMNINIEKEYPKEYPKILQRIKDKKTECRNSENN